MTQQGLYIASESNMATQGSGELCVQSDTGSSKMPAGSPVQKTSQSSIGSPRENGKQWSCVHCVYFCHLTGRWMGNWCLTVCADTPRMAMVLSGCGWWRLPKTLFHNPVWDRHPCPYPLGKEYIGQSEMKMNQHMAGLQQWSPLTCFTRKSTFYTLFEKA